MLSRVVKLKEAEDSATCETDTSETHSPFPIEEKTSFESLFNISTGEEVLSEATETLQGRAAPLNPWRTRQEKNKSSRHPPTGTQTE